MKTISALIMLSALIATPALAQEQAHFKILDVLAQGNCGPAEPIINSINGNPSIDFIFPQLRVDALDGRSVESKLCNVRVHIKVEPGYTVGLGEVFVEGAVSFDPGAGSGGYVSARSFFLGRRGLNGFRSFNAGEKLPFTVDVKEGSPDNTTCGAETYLNLLVDISAREKPGNDEMSQISIERGVQTTEGFRVVPVISCGIHPTPCDVF